MGTGSVLDDVVFNARLLLTKVAFEEQEALKVIGNVDSKGYLIVGLERAFIAFEEEEGALVRGPMVDEVVARFGDEGTLGAAMAFSVAHRLVVTLRI